MQTLIQLGINLEVDYDRRSTMKKWLQNEIQITFLGQQPFWNDEIPGWSFQHSLRHFQT